MSKAKKKEEIKIDPSQTVAVVGKAQVTKTDMSDEMLAKTIEIVSMAIAINKFEKDMCNQVKSQMDVVRTHSTFFACLSRILVTSCLCLPLGCILGC